MNLSMEKYFRCGRAGIRAAGGLAACAMLALPLIGTGHVMPVEAASPVCVIDKTTADKWIKTPDMAALKEVPNNNGDPKDSSNCDFYKFGWQWFLYLVRPNSAVPTIRNFEDRSIYPIIDVDNCNSIPASPTTERKVGASLTHSIAFPEAVGQAGPGDALYDKNGNITFYNRRFTKSECYTASGKNINYGGNFPDAGAANPNFPTGVDQVVEFKSSWRIITEAEKANYYWVTAEIANVGPKTVGMTGMHVVVNTHNHSEFVWLTWEHKDNAPDCTVTLDSTSGAFNLGPPANGWSYASSACSACVKPLYATNGTDLVTSCASQCNFKAKGTLPVTRDGKIVLTGTPSNICRTDHFGGGTADNLQAVQDTNTSFVGPDGALTKLAATDPMAIWSNYFLGGGIWDNLAKKTSNTQKFSTYVAGSLDLANMAMESFTQSDDTTGSGHFYKPGCFFCHDGQADQTANVSHILSNIHTCDIEAGPIWNQQDADAKCPQVCKTANASGWNKQWRTTVPGTMSVCGCTQCPKQ